MHDLDLILTLAGGLAAALAFGYLTHRLGLSPIVGYLLAGILVGPHTPGFVADQALAEQLADIGVILLMFGVGLQFHLNELVAVRRVAVPGALGQSLVATVLGAAVARGFGWSWGAGIVFGLALAVASTVVLVRVLSDSRDLHTPAGHIAVGWLVVEDLFTVLVLVLMPALFLDNGGGWAVARAAGLAAGKVGLLVTFAVVAGGRAIPWLLDRVARTQSRELFTLTVLVVALGIAVGSALLFDVSMALGAFLAGLIVGRSEFSLRAASEALPMRDAFAVLFFVSVGMLLDPRFVLEAWPLVLATLAVIVVGKPLAAYTIVVALGHPRRTALAVAAALAQIGEFSFIMARLGSELGVLDLAATNTLIAASIVSITLNPLLYRAADRLNVWMIRRQLPAGAPPFSDAASDAPPAHRAVVIGYGPVGRTVTRLLRENEIEPTVIELNLETVRALKSEGVAAVYGDASRRAVLEEAGVGRAGFLILSSDRIPAAPEIIRLARELNPRIQILARSAYLRDAAALARAGATRVFAGEAEVALALTEAILRSLGATPEQIERERARVHTDVVGSDHQ